jgi:ABC-type sugar transport system substrate-binding protein
MKNFLTKYQDVIGLIAVFGPMVIGIIHLIYQALTK